LAIQNTLRYVPSEHHSLLAKEFADELQKYGHIYAYRFMPDFELKVDVIPFFYIIEII
jgi:urocanate hydratase